MDCEGYGIGGSGTASQWEIIIAGYWCEIEVWLEVCDYECYFYFDLCAIGWSFRWKSSEEMVYNG